MNTKHFVHTAEGDVLGPFASASEGLRALEAHVRLHPPMTEPNQKERPMPMTLNDKRIAIIMGALRAVDDHVQTKREACRVACDQQRPLTTPCEHIIEMNNVLATFYKAVKAVTETEAPAAIRDPRLFS